MAIKKGRPYSLNQQYWIIPIIFLLLVIIWLNYSSQIKDLTFRNEKQVVQLDELKEKVMHEIKTHIIDSFHIDQNHGPPNKIPVKILPDSQKLRYSNKYIISKNMNNKF